MHTIFFDQNNTLRSGWRAVIFLLLFALTAGIASALVQVSFNAFGISPFVSPGVAMGINSLVSLAAAIVVGWLCGKWFEKLPFEALGASPKGKWVKNFLLGSLVGTLTFSAAVLAAMSGGLGFTASSAPASEIAVSLLSSFAIFAVAAAFEEALFRGYFLQTFARAGYAWFAILLTSVFFGLVHANNPNANIFSTFNTIIAGIWFSIAYLKTRELWFVTAIHLMWNWVQGSVFGIEVSGIRHLAGISALNEIDPGPGWLTGGDYGIEGGIACTIALVVSTLAIWFWPRSRDLDLE